MGLQYVVWQVTNRCNLDCIHCRGGSSPYASREGELSTEQCKAVIDQLSELPSVTIAFTGGEPLLRPDLSTLVRHATQKGIRVRVQSNGLLLSKQIAIELRDAGVFSIGVGLDGPNAAVHEFVRNTRGSFTGALRGIRNTKKESLLCHVEYTITRVNRGAIAQTVGLCRELGVDTFLARSALPTGRTAFSTQLFRLTAIEYRAALQDILRARKANPTLTINSQDPLYILIDDDLRTGVYGEGRSVQQILAAPDTIVCSGCTAGLTMLYIYSNGDVAPCSFCSELRLGNLKSVSLSEIWHDRFDLLEPILSRGFEGSCGQCEHKWICGGCRARAKAVFGSYLASDPYCWLANGENGKH